MNEFGIYKYVYENEIIYIGRTHKSIYSRIVSHSKEPKFEQYLSEAKIFYFLCDNALDTNIYESYLINKYKPILNIANTNGPASKLAIEEPEWIPYEIYLEKIIKQQEQQEQKNYKKLCGKLETSKEISYEQPSDWKARGSLSIRHDIIRSNIPIDAKLAYLALRYVIGKFSISDENKDLVTYDLRINLYNLLDLFADNDFKADYIKKIKKAIINGLKILEDSKYITTYDWNGGLCFNIIFNKLDLLSEPHSELGHERPSYNGNLVTMNDSRNSFSYISINEIKRLAKITCIKTIIYYCTLVDTIDDRIKYGFTSIRTFREYTGLGKTTIRSYNDFFIDNNFLCFYKSNRKLRNDFGQLSGDSLKYCLLENEEEVFKLLSEWELGHEQPAQYSICKGDLATNEFGFELPVDSEQEEQEEEYAW